MLTLTDDKARELDRVQREVNSRVSYRTDLALYGRAELWRVAADKGDCEDYALAKRQMLLDLGWPLEALRLAVCNVETGEGHAVLMVDTANEGTLVLDNRYPGVVPWNRLPYEWLRRQDGKGGWVRIGR